MMRCLSAVEPEQVLLVVVLPAQVLAVVLPVAVPDLEYYASQ